MTALLFCNPYTYLILGLILALGFWASPYEIDLDEEEEL